MSVYKSIITGLEEAVAHETKNGKARKVKLTIVPVSEFKAQEIKGLRNKLGMTQVVFASFMGVSPKTVEAWESGRNTPEGPARRLLEMVKADPTIPQKLEIVI